MEMRQDAHLLHLMQKPDLAPLGKAAAVPSIS
jgi:hypothetical protein